MVTPADSPDAALASEVEALRRRLDALAQLPEQVTELANLLTQLAGDGRQGSDDLDRQLPASWLDLSDCDEAAAAEALAQLVAWMARIYLRYPDAAAGLPDCWAWHPDVVEELVCLAGSWAVAYRSDQAGPALATDWHDRHRPGAVARIRAAAGTCSLENHLPGGPHHHPAAGVPLRAAAAAVASWWAHERDQTPPRPEPDHLAESEARRTSRRGTRP